MIRTSHLGGRGMMYLIQEKGSHELRIFSTKGPSPHVERKFDVYDVISLHICGIPMGPDTHHKWRRLCIEL